MAEEEGSIQEGILLLKEAGEGLRVRHNSASQNKEKNG